MRISRLLIIGLLLAVPGFAPAAVAANGVPETSTWYFHADFEQMRTSDAGRHLYSWLQREVFEEIREEAGFDIDNEADSVTAFADEMNGAVVLIEGKISQDSKDKLLALAAGADSFDTFEHKGKTFHFADDDDHGHSGDDNDIEIDSFENGTYFSFALKNRILATSTREKMESLLASNGKLPSRKTANGTLIVLSAEKSLIQAGMKADRVDDDGDGGWQSNILRNTEQVAVLVADVAGKIAVETQLVAKQPEMAESLASIVRGLISLTMFSDDMDPEISQFLNGTTVDVDGSKLKISVSVDPEKLVAALDD
jgi:hypothetical protein